MNSEVTDSAYYFFIAWFFILLGFWAMLKSEGTRTILYYLIILAIVLDLIINAKQIQTWLENAGIITPQNPIPPSSTIHGPGAKE